MHALQVGVVELVLFACTAGSLIFLSGKFRKWAICIAPIILVSMLFTPADLASTLVVAAPLTFVFVGGVVVSDWIRDEPERTPARKAGVR